MILVVITGMSGAGKSVATNAFEDMGYYCVDNLPPQLLPKFVELCEQSSNITHAALVVDVRGGDFFDLLEQQLNQLHLPVKILFLEAGNETLVRRFKESRRSHPLNPQGSIEQGIELERQRLTPLRRRADVILDTSEMKPSELRLKVLSSFPPMDSAAGKMNISVVSFGFRHGLPLDADLVFDVRFLPNPHYQEELRELTGRQEVVQNYVLAWTITHQLLDKLRKLLVFLLPCYVEEGKNQLIIAIGCTAGKHRSVVIADKLTAFLKQKGYSALSIHRDVEK